MKKSTFQQRVKNLANRIGSDPKTAEFIIMELRKMLDDQKKKN